MYIGFFKVLASREICIYIFSRLSQVENEEDASNVSGILIFWYSILYFVGKYFRKVHF